MEHTKGQIQQQQQQQQNQSKKKSKNKKKSSKNDSVVTTRPIIDDNDEQQQEQYQQKSSEGAVVVVENGLTDQIKQLLHIGNNNGTNLNNTSNISINSSTSSSSSSRSNNNNKVVNGLLRDNLKISSIACPTPTTDLENAEHLQKVPALNGHHHVMEQQQDATAAVVPTTSKKSKRKPNNKKNANNIVVEEDVDVSKHLKNGHCHPHDMMMVTTNGFKHKEEEEQQTDVTNTAIKANKTNNTTNIITTTTTTDSTTNRVESNGQHHQQQQQQHSSKALETVSISQNTEPAKELDLTNVHIEYKEYESELQMHDIMRLIQAELSEPYSIYTYRYFIYNWPKLCFLAAHGNEYVGAIVCKLDMHMNVRRGYIAMLAVRKEYRKLKIGTTLVQKAIEAMLADNADEVVLETEMSNLPALRLYENLGFVRDKRLFRYYLNGVDALRLKLWFR